MLGFGWAKYEVADDGTLIGLNRCPWAIITTETWLLLEIWTDWKNLGVLPFPGDLAAQPYYVYQTIKFCELIRREVEHARATERAAADELERRRLTGQNP